MATPVRIQPSVFFYAVGNTPAVCLTQSLPPEQDAAILLLGCGDARSILATTYADLGHGNRRLDITCCDNEVEILARNIILFTILVDDARVDNIDKIWNIYYHITIDESSLQLLQEHSAKIQAIADTADEWNNGEYGSLVRFADNYTFSLVKQLWGLYSLNPSHGNAYEELQQKLRRVVSKARRLQKKFVGNAQVTTGMRSAAPCSSKSILDMPQLYDRYWKNGTVFPTQASAAGSKGTLNPMFGALDEALVLHYGSDPLYGYHLAAAYAPLSPRSRLSPDFSGSKSARCFEAAFTQFKEYATSFRNSATRLTLRFVNADALAFCHTLQHLRKHGTSTASWYRKLRTFVPLVLDSMDYHPSEPANRAPLSFDIIDTSNLMDHIGCLNLFAATAPLLRSGLCSTLSTEMLVLRGGSLEENTRDVILGDFPTISLLFGLVPVQYWTGGGTVSTFEDRLFDDLFSRGPGSDTQARYVCIWKSMGLGSQGLIESDTANPARVAFSSVESLSSFLFKLYLEMFKDECLIKTLSLTPRTLRQRANGQHYTRASFVSLLALLHDSGLDNWETSIQQLCERIMADSSLLLGAHHFQELFVHLHLAGLFQVPDYDSMWKGILDHGDCFLGDWSTIPAALCITMVVPRKALSVFGYGSSTPTGTPIAHIMLQRSEGSRQRTQNIFPDIQLGFGTLKTSGVRFTEDYVVEVEDDPKFWDGDGPLIVSAVVPSYLLFMDSNLSTEVIFGLKSSPESLAQFSPKLGVQLVISRSTLGGNDVYITKYRPNMSGHTSFCGKVLKSNENASAGPSETPQVKPQVQFYSSFTPDNSKLAALTTHVEIPEGQGQEFLRTGAAIRVSQSSPFEIDIEVGSMAPIKNIRLPVPVQLRGSKTRIARKSSYIELISPVMPHKSFMGRPDSLYLINSENGSPKLINLHYLSLDRLPILDLNDPSKLAWLNTHLVDMFSAREWREREEHQNLPTLPSDARVNYKDSLHSLFMFFSGVQGDRRYTMFGLDNSVQGGVNAIILPAYLRLDTSSQSVVLDAAVIPLLKRDMRQLLPTIRLLQQRGIRAIRVNDAELRLWKHVLPSLVERCRTWKHTPSCEYRVQGKIPLSVETGKSVICSCGRGKFPKGWKIEEPGVWKHLCNHAVRVAITPCFSVPFVERPFGAEDFDELTQFRSSSCDACGRTARLMKCGGCRVAKYCSKECQKMDWRRGHKEFCEKLRESVAFPDF